MIYREAGDFKTSYAADGQTFPLALDRRAYWALMLVAFVVVPLVITPYWANAVLLPVPRWPITITPPIAGSIVQSSSASFSSSWPTSAAKG